MVTSPWQQKCQRAGCTLLGCRLCQCLGTVCCSSECAAADWRNRGVACQVAREIPQAPAVIDAGGEQILGRMMMKQVRRRIGAVLEFACAKKPVMQAESFLGGRQIATVHSDESNRQRAYLRRAIGLVLERVVRRPPGPAMRQVLTSELLGRTARMQKVGSALITSKVVAYLAHPWWKSRGSKAVVEQAPARRPRAFGWDSRGARRAQLRLTPLTRGPHRTRRATTSRTNRCTCRRGLRHQS